MSGAAAEDEFRELPVDSDVGRRTGQPGTGLTLVDLVLVFAGGALGTALRALISVALPSVAGVPAGTLMVNLTGAFALGVLLEWLGGSGPDIGWRRRVRLLCGTGFLGGFTTYSALALEATEGDVAPVVGALYALGSVVVGALLALAGILTARVAGRRIHRPGRDRDE